jgi:hypothetical protein
MLLVPTGILIVLILTAITVDAALGFMAERSAASIASSAANDVASLGIDVEHFRATGEYRLSDDVQDAIDVVTASARVQAGQLFIPGSFAVEVTVIDSVTVQVVVRGEVDRLVLSSMSGGPFAISARAFGTVDTFP